MPRSKDPKKKKTPAIRETATASRVPSLTKVTRHGQITLPSEVRRAMEIEEGDLIQVDMEDDRIVLVPKRLVDKSQAYFWTPVWQAAEAEAEADIEAGRVQSFSSTDALIEDLDD